MIKSIPKIQAAYKLWVFLVLLVGSFSWSNLQAQDCGEFSVDAVNLTAASCPSSGSVTVVTTGSGLTFRLLDGPEGYPASTNTTGIFNSLSPGNYKVEVKNACSETLERDFVIVNSYPAFSVASGIVVPGSMCSSANPTGAELRGTVQGGRAPFQYDFVKLEGGIPVSVPTYSPAVSALSHTETVTEFGVYRFYALDACGEVRTIDVSVIPSSVTPVSVSAGAIGSPVNCNETMDGLPVAQLNLYLANASAAAVSWAAMAGGSVEIWEPDADITASGMNCSANPTRLIHTYTTFGTREYEVINIPQKDVIIIIKPPCGEAFKYCLNFTGISPLDISRSTVFSSSCNTTFESQTYDLFIDIRDGRGPYQVEVKDKNDATIGTINIPVITGSLFRTFSDYVTHDQFPITVEVTDACGKIGTKVITAPAGSASDPVTAVVTGQVYCQAQEGTLQATLTAISGYIPDRAGSTVTITGGPLWATPHILPVSWNTSAFILEGLVAGHEYTITWTNSCGGETEFKFTVPTGGFPSGHPPFSSNIATEVDALCGQNAANVRIIPNTNFSNNHFTYAVYSLVNDAGAVYQSNGSGVFSNVPPGEYTARWTVSWGAAGVSGCPTDHVGDSTTVTVLGDGVDQSIIRKTILICEDETGLPMDFGKATIEVNGAPPFTYEIIKKDVLDADPATTAWVTSISGTNSNTYTWELPLPGDPLETEYVLRSVDKCENKITTQASLQPLAPPVFESDMMPCVGVENYNMTVVPYAGDFEYRWVKLSDPGTVLSTTNSLTLSGVYTPSHDGTYRCYVTLDGCIDRYIDRVLSSTAPGFTVSADQACVGDDITMSATGGSSYLWEGPGGFTSSDASVTLSNVTEAQSGLYKVTVTNAEGCALTSDTTIVIEPCVLPVFDLALRKVLPNGVKNPTVTPGSTVTFKIEVWNQGTVAAQNIAVVDYIPEGLTLADGNWTPGTGVATLTNPIAALAAGDSTSVNISFTVSADFTGSIRNFAEISGADNIPGLPDVDSTPDTDSDNDGTPKDDEINNAEDDEDDHDYEDITVSPAPVFDLALRKVLPNGVKNPTVTPGSTVTFKIEVWNQGTVAAQNIAVIDYIPEGLTLADGNWTPGTGVATLTNPIAALAAGDSTSVTITFTVDADFTGSTLRNFAEISGADNIPGLPDVDSTPDTDPDNDGTPKDDEINNAEEDEDDHDYEDITVSPAPVFDLALRKVLPSGAKNPTVTPGSTVTFKIEVWNQGTVAAQNIAVIDYIPEGLTLADGNWTPGTGVATLTNPIAALAAGDSTSVNISFTVNADFTGSIRNFAEISGADNIPGLPDVDSTPDTDPDNDGTPKDDEINNEEDDEDDHDYEDITVSPAPVFDLALRKVLPNGAKNPTVTPGSTVTFKIEVWNQGTVAAQNIAVVDYIPEGLILADANWTPGTGVATLTNPIAALAAGDSTSVNISFTVNADFTGSIRNFAEISGADNIPGLPDVDSIPDNDPDNDGTPKDDEINNEEDDEDDHDYEDITVSPAPVFDLALRKTMAPGSKTIYKVGDEVTFNITVFNQGTVTATSVDLVDYIPAGLTLEDDNWTLDGDKARWIGAISNLIAGAQETVQITFVINSSATGVVVNTAEISGATNPENLEDIDSTPDDDKDNDGQPKNDEINEDGKNNPNDDEDDHDIEPITICPDAKCVNVKTTRTK